MKQPQSIFSNIARIFQSSADALSSISITVSTTAEIGESLAQAGLTMAESNQELVRIDTEGNHQEKLIELYKRYPSLKPV